MLTVYGTQKEKQLLINWKLERVQKKATVYYKLIPELAKNHTVNS